MPGINNSEQHSHRKRGRPRLNGRRGPRLFYRSLLLVYLYNEARKREPKHEAALAETVCEFRNLYPQAKISLTPVKRALAEYQPHHAQMAWKIVPTPDAEITRLIEICHQLGRPEAWKIVRAPEAEKSWLIDACQQLAQLGGMLSDRPKLVLDFGIGPRPSHPRSNARNKSYSKNGSHTPET